MKFSIATPSFNQAPFLPQCLESVRQQTDHSLSVEHVVIDGGSTDGSVQILEQWATETKKQKAENYQFFYQSGPDGGQTEAINRGLAQTSGEIIAYLCSDDFYEPKTFQKVAAVFTTYPEIDFVYGDYFFLEGDSGWKRRKRCGTYSVKRLEKNNFLAQPAVFWRSTVWQQFGPLDEQLRYCMDHEFWLRVRGQTRWHYLPEPLATSRLHEMAKTSSQILAAWNETANMTKRYGLERRFKLKASWMKWGGATYYQTKRRLFAMIGNWMR